MPTVPSGYNSCDMTMPIFTERLHLRRFTMADVPTCYDSWMSDQDVTEFLTWNAHSDINVTAIYIASCISEYRFGSMDWCITQKKYNMPIGSISAVQDFPNKRYCELGYCLSKDHWNKGIMTEALCAVCRWIFDNTDYLWIQARYDSENEASGRCMEKANFKKVLEFEDLCKKRNQVRHYTLGRIERRDIMTSLEV